MSFQSTEIPNPFASGAVTESIKNQPQAQKANELAKKKFEEGLSLVTNPQTPYEKKLDTIIDLNTQILPFIFQELSSQIPNPDRSVIASRLCQALRDTTSIIVKKREEEKSEEINPESPKFQKCFEWFIEAVYASMEEAGVDSVSVNNTFNALANKLQGWEIAVSKNLRGLSSKALDTVSNPFIEEFKEKLQNPPQPVMNPESLPQNTILN